MSWNGLIRSDNSKASLPGSLSQRAEEPASLHPQPGKVDYFCSNYLYNSVVQKLSTSACALSLVIYPSTTGLPRRLPRSKRSWCWASTPPSQATLKVSSFIFLFSYALHCDYSFPISWSIFILYQACHAVVALFIVSSFAIICSIKTSLTGQGPHLTWKKSLSTASGLGNQNILRLDLGHTRLRELLPVLRGCCDIIKWLALLLIRVKS